METKHSAYLAAPEVLKAKRWLPLPEYFLHLGQYAADHGLMDDGEFKVWCTKFQKIGLPPKETTQMLERIIINKYIERGSKDDFIQEKPGDAPTLFDKVVNFTRKLRKQKYGQRNDR